MGATDKKSASKGSGGREAMIYFAVAFLFLLAGLGSLVFNSKSLFEGDFSSSRVIGGVHWITLGWLTTSIFGALQVFSGVALGATGLGSIYALVSLGVWAVGVMLFPGGLILQSNSLIYIGVVLLTAGLGLQTIQIGYVVLKAQRGALTRLYLIASTISFWCAWFLGAGAAAQRTGHRLWPIGDNFLSAHILVALFGWGGATVVGVGTHLVPMFALSAGASHKPVKIAFPFWASLPLWALLALFVNQGFLLVGWISAFIGSSLWVIQVSAFYQKRTRKEVDPGLSLVAGATIMLAASWPILAVTKSPPLFVGTVLVGWLTLFTLGIYHRVVPFLIWMKRFRAIAGVGTPKVRELTSSFIGFSTAATALFGASIWLLGLGISNIDLLMGGSLLLFASAVASLFQIPFLLRTTTAPAGTRVAAASQEARFQ